MALRTSFRTPICLVDLSYYLHLRISASISGYLRDFGSELNIDMENLYDYNFVDDDEFIAQYRKDFKRGIQKFLHAHESTTRHTILAKDCCRKNIWRRLIFEGYKAGRDKPKKQKEANQSPIFSYTYDVLLPEWESVVGFKLVEAKRAEGDDVIAVLAEYLLNEDPDNKIVIMANDMDIAQIANDKISIYDTRGNSINEKVNTRYGSPRRMIKVKMLQGDRSDDIPNICKGMGEKTAMKCLDDRELLRSKLLASPNAPKQFKLNRKLVDFSYIPSIVKEEILENYKAQL